jgi:hypothetical protein
VEGFFFVPKICQSHYRRAGVSLAGGSWHRESAGWTGRCSNDHRLCGLHLIGCYVQERSRNAGRCPSCGWCMDTGSSVCFFYRQSYSESDQRELSSS